MNDEFKCRRLDCDNHAYLINVKIKDDTGQVGGKCPNCGYFSWIPLEKNEDKRPASQKNLVKKKKEITGIDYCEICLTKESDLPNKQFFVGHHVIPYKDGGSSEVQNIQILCNSCHSLVHWVRNYKKHT